MFATLTSFVLVLGHVLPGLSVPVANRTISTELFNDLRFYFQYASSTHVDSCPKPNGNTLVLQLSNVVTDTQGFIARDDYRKEIVVTMRGSTSLEDILVDAVLVPVPYGSPGVSAPFGTLVHAGFLTAYNSIANTVISTVRDQLKSYPNYTLVATGHSMGGALASLAAASLKGNFPQKDVRMYTYGQPRTGNPSYAFWINDKLGSNVFRSVHTNDFVPFYPPKALLSEFPFALGYRHHGVEYWQNPDPASPATTIQCSPGGEDPTCSASQGLQNFPIGTDPHGLYYGVPAAQAFCT